MEIHSNYILKQRPTNSIVNFYSKQQRNKTENVLLHLCLSTHLNEKHTYMMLQCKAIPTSKLTKNIFYKPYKSAQTSKLSHLISL